MFLSAYALQLAVIASIVLAKTSSTTVYVGTYTGDGPSDSKGIYAFTLDQSQSTLTPLGLAIEASSPSYLLVHPSQKYLYSVNEQDEGGVSAYRIDSSPVGHLTLINQQSSRGSGPCYLSTTRAGNYLFVSNYNNGTVAALPLDTNTGSIQPFTGFDQQTGSSIFPVRQTSPHAHCILFDKKEEFLVSADLGSDQIYHYKFLSNNGSLLRTSITNAARPGDGPRHIIFNSNQKFLYILNELSSVVTVYNYSPVMQLIQVISTLPTNFTGVNTAAELLLHPVTEKYLYASNRGHNSITVFAVDSNSGTLELIQRVDVQGQTPRNFRITSNGKFLLVANQDSNNLVLFTIDGATGKLTATGTSVAVSKPTCVKFLD